MDVGREKLWRCAAMVCMSPAVCLCGAAAVVDRPLELNIEANTREWLARLDAGEVGSYAIVGDSISYRGNSYNWFLRDLLQNRYGNAGDGYLAIASGFAHNPDEEGGRRPGLGFRNRGPIWVHQGAAQGRRDEFGVRSVDGIYTRIGGPGWVELDFFGVEATLHYVREPGAGVLRIELNGQRVGEIDANITDSQPELGLFTFPTGQADPDTLNTVRISLVGATDEDPQWTQLNGLHMTTGRGGALYHRVARGGAGPWRFLEADRTIHAHFIQSLDLDLLVIMLDPGSDFRYPNFPQYFAELLDFYETTVPEVEIVVMSHHPFRPDREQVTEWQIEAARGRGYGFINLHDHHTGRAHMNLLGFLDDEVHLTAAGGRWFARYVDFALHGWTPPDAVTVNAGDQTEGELYELRNSDDDPLVVRSEPFFDVNEPNRAITSLELSTDLVPPRFLDLAFEWSISIPGGTAAISAMNWRTNLPERIAELPLGMTEETHVLEGLDADLYVRAADGAIVVETRVVVVASFGAAGFDLSVDHIRARVRSQP